MKGVGGILWAVPIAASVLLLLGLISGAKAENAASSAAGKSAEQVYKNIQVLKGIPADQLIPAMQFITASLGVECGFCHVRDHFDQDDKKPKQTARKMIQMMMTINQNDFEGHREVTCNSCHRGSRVPAAIPALSDEPPPARLTSEEGQPSQNLPTVDRLITKYIQASGGEEALKKVFSRYEKGTMNLLGREIAVEIFDKAPDKRVSITHLPEGDTATAFDGREGWLISPQRPVREMPESETPGARIDADMQFPLHLKEDFAGLKSGPSEKLGDREVYQFVAEAGQPRGRLYFDQDSGLLVRMIRYSDSPLGLNPVLIDYSDYRPVDGVEVPFRWTVARPSGRVTIQLTSVAQNVTIDDGKFAKPAGAAEARR
jgi:outer membrane lipoprotein-sorting protein